MKTHRLVTALALCGALGGGLAACGDEEGPAASGGGEGAAQEELSGKVTIDGSSTVQPFAEAAAELFGEEQPGVQVTVGGAGTGAGAEPGGGEWPAGQPVWDPAREAYIYWDPAKNEWLQFDYATGDWGPISRAGG